MRSNYLLIASLMAAVGLSLAVLPGCERSIGDDAFDAATDGGDGSTTPTEPPDDPTGSED